MSELDEVMKSPRLMVQRANRHIDELRRRTSPLDADLFEITNRREYPTVLHRNLGPYELTFRPKENIPEALAVIVGDVLGNLRAALDHLAVGIVSRWGTMPSAPLYFPVTQRKDLLAHLGLTAIEQALPGSKKLLLDEIRPNAGPTEHLWNFYTLNKDDKHNFLIPNVGVVGVSGIDAWIGDRSRLNGFNFKFDATRTQVIIRSHRAILVNNDHQVDVEVTFGKGTPFENEPVIPTLLQISEVVSKTLNGFERLIRRSKL